MNGPYDDGQAHAAPAQDAPVNEQQKNLPIDTIREGALKATIWRNESQKGTYHTVNVARTYKDDQGNLRDTNSFRAQDMLGLAELARQAHHRSHDLNRAAFKEQRQQEPEPQREPTRGR
ncbi:MAG: hypothetical protein ACFB03_03250 [Paracoccaceae bacterium]